MNSRNLTLTPRDHANLTLLKVNTYGFSIIGFGIGTYFLIRFYDNFLRGTIIQQEWIIYTIIGASALFYSLFFGFITFWVKAYIDAAIIWAYGQFLYDRIQKRKREDKNDRKK